MARPWGGLRVEWDAQAQAAVTTGASEALHAVQEATEVDLGDALVLALEGKRTQSLPLGPSATEVRRQALQAQRALGAVHVTRR